MVDPCPCDSTSTLKITSQVISGTPDPNTGTGPKGDTGPAGPQGSPILHRSLTIQGTFTDPVMLMFTDKAITVRKVLAVVSGTTPTATLNVYQASTANGIGTPIFQLSLVADAVATGNAVPGDQDFTDDPMVIPADRFVWLKVSATTGTLTSLFIQFSYQMECEDCI